MKTAQTLPVSKLTANKQELKFTKTFKDSQNQHATIIATVRHDDTCGNGHNTFAITGNIFESTADGRRKRGGWESGGCIHDEIREHFPELAPFIKWHLTSIDGPMHYIANTVYYADLARQGGDQSRYAHQSHKTAAGCLDSARSCAVFPDAPDEFFAVDDGEQEIYPGVHVPLTSFNRLKSDLEKRLPALMTEFKAAVESLGLVY